MKQVFLFSGQGSQSKGMIQDICKAYPKAHAIVRAAHTITGKNIESLLWETEKEDFARNDSGQLALITVHSAITAVLHEHDIMPAAVAGFSLGEFSALHAAGVLNFENLLYVVQQRGKIMNEVCAAFGTTDAKKQTNGNAGMAAVLRLSPEKTAKLLLPYSDVIEGTVFLANINSPSQTVVAGTAEGLAAAEHVCKAAGAKRFIRLPVAGPFHSPLMAAAAAAFEKAIRDIPFKNPTIPLFSNVTGKQITCGDEARKNAVLHLTSPVLWTRVEKEVSSFMNKNHIDPALEIGAGATLCTFWRDRLFDEHEIYESDYEKQLRCLPTGTLDTLNAAITEITDAKKMLKADAT